MNLILSSILSAGLLIVPTLPAVDNSRSLQAEPVAGKKCRMVDMCWFKNGKRYCFKKRVCD